MAELRFTPSEVSDFFGHPIWAVLAERFQREFEAADREIEDADAFKHGRASGKREVYRMFLALPKVLAQEASGKGPYNQR